MSFGENVKFRRTSMGMTQGELADKAGLTLGQISKIERGLGNPKLETIEKIIEGLQCDASDLLTNSKRVRSRYASEVLSNYDSFCPANQKAIIQVMRAMISDESINQLVTVSRLKAHDAGYVDYLDHLEEEDDREKFEKTGIPPQ